MSEKELRLKKIAAALAANGVRYDSNLTYLVKNGYGSEDCEALSDQIVELLYNATVNGINNGFSRGAKTEIESLSALAASLASPKAAKNIGKAKDAMELSRRRLGALAAEPLPANNSPLGVVKQYIATSIAGIDATMPRLSSENQKNILSQSRAVLTGIQADLEQIWDYSSASAGETAQKIISTLSGWRKSVSNKLVTSATLQTLTSIQGMVAQWGNLQLEAKKKGTVAGYVDDDLDFVIRSTAVMESVETFQTIANEYLDESKELFSAREFRETRDSLREEIRQLRQQDQDNIAAYRNGTMDGDTVFEEHKDIEARIADLTAEIAEIDHQITEERELHQQSKAIVRQLKPVFDVFRQIKRNPVATYEIFSGIDFNALSSVFNGTNPMEMDNAVLQIFTVLQAKGIINENRQVITSRIEQYERVFQEQTGQKTTQQVREEQQQQQQQQQAERDAFLASLMGGPTTQPQTPVDILADQPIQQTQQQQQAAAFNIDDI